MAVCRVEKTSNYTVMANYHIDDHELSLKAKGLLSTMLRLPEDWDYSVEGLAKLCKDGRAAIKSALDELETSGYVRRRQLHSDAGTFAGYEYLIYEAPTLIRLPLAENLPTVDLDAPLAGFPSTEKPSTENQQQLNTKLTKDLKTNTPLPPKRGKRDEAKAAPDWKPERFDAFWKFYPCGKSKQAAIKAWDKLKLPDEEIDAMARVLKRQMQTAQWQRGIGIPYASTYLNNRRWEDEERPPIPAVPNAGRVVAATEVAEI